jgi:hypothetical protein
MRSRCTFVGTLRTGNQDETLLPEVSLNTQSDSSLWIDSAILKINAVKNGNSTEGFSVNKYRETGHSSPQGLVRSFRAFSLYTADHIWVANR